MQIGRTYRIDGKEYVLCEYIPEVGNFIFSDCSKIFSCTLKHDLKPLKIGFNVQCMCVVYDDYDEKSYLNKKSYGILQKNYFICKGVDNKCVYLSTNNFNFNEIDVPFQPCGIIKCVYDANDDSCDLITFYNTLDDNNERFANSITIYPTPFPSLKYFDKMSSCYK